MSGYQDEKPGWGKTIGAFFLCGCLAVGACVIVSSMLARGVGFTGYSSGGITGALTGAICAAVYRSSGKLEPRRCDGFSRGLARARRARGL